MLVMFLNYQERIGKYAGIRSAKRCTDSRLSASHVSRGGKEQNTVVHCQGQRHPVILEQG